MLRQLVRALLPDDSGLMGETRTGDEPAKDVNDPVSG